MDSQQIQPDHNYRDVRSSTLTSSPEPAADTPLTSASPAGTDVPPVAASTLPAHSVEPQRRRFRLRLRTRSKLKPPPRRPGSSRETIESLVIAFVLAFLFRTYEAEAFVIPTGSMAPTLVGRHRDATCPQCQYEYKISASEEIEEQDGTTVLQTHKIRTHAVCPNCQYLHELPKGDAFKGDRILVLKFPYRLPGITPGSIAEPNRWDVVVFKYPEDPQTNYIKRLVGLPHEELRIHYGDVYTRKSDGPFEIARKSAEKQSVMRMLVYDNNFQPADWKRHGWKPRWEPEPNASPWIPLDEERAFAINADEAQADWARLRYHHRILVRDSKDVEATARPVDSLITDDYGYNAGLTEAEYESGFAGIRDAHWVGDLAIACRLDVDRTAGKLRFELVEAGTPMHCEFDLNTGACRLLRNDEEVASSPDGIRQPGRYRVVFSNTDDRLSVSVNDRRPFGDGVDFDSEAMERGVRPTAADLQPVSIDSLGAGVRVSDLVIYRDIYYTHARGTECSLSGVDLSDPNAWERIGDNRPYALPPLDADQFVMLGDNSPRSKDSRLWTDGAMAYLNDLPGAHTMSYSEQRELLAQRQGAVVFDAPKHVVHRQLLIGKAFFVYWPHGVPFDWSVNVLSGGRDLRLPFYPQFTRMKLVR